MLLVFFAFVLAFDYLGLLARRISELHTHRLARQDGLSKIISHHDKPRGTYAAVSDDQIEQSNVRASGRRSACHQSGKRWRRQRLPRFCELLGKEEIGTGNASVKLVDQPFSP